MSVVAVILAAGYGKRMQGDCPKVLQKIAGKPMLVHVLNTVAKLELDAAHLVCGHAQEQVRACVEAQAYTQPPVFHQQAEQIGTANAVACAAAAFEADQVLILYGDVPCIRSEKLFQMLNQLDHADLVVLTLYPEKNDGYGRVVRNAQGKVVRIVEEKDTSPDEKAIAEVSSGIMAVRGKHLKVLLDQVENNNAQGEYYLPDIVALACKADLRVATEQLEDFREALGVNTFAQLHDVERYFQEKQARQLLEQGCQVRDVLRLDIRGDCVVGKKVVIDVNVVLEGQIKLGDGVSIGANCHLKDVTIGQDTEIKPFTMVEGAKIGKQCLVGPYARLRPDTRIDDQAQVGNFVEVKKSSVGARSKVNHLSYIGDSTIGTNTNVGAGTITCNYDGANKHQTIIGDRVFIGSGTQLVAPVTIADGATIGAGSTITKDAPQDTLTLSRSEMKTVPGWIRPKKADQ